MGHCQAFATSTGSLIFDELSSDFPWWIIARVYVYIDEAVPHRVGQGVDAVHGTPDGLGAVGSSKVGFPEHALSLLAIKGDRAWLEQPEGHGP